MAGRRLRNPRHLGVIFVATMVLLLALFGGLSWWLLDQDRQLAEQRRSQLRELSAAMAATELERRLSTIDRQLGELTANDEATVPDPPGEGALFVRWRQDAFRVWPASGLLYRPDGPAALRAVPDVFGRADALEFAQKNPRAALVALAPLAQSSDVAIRAEALGRIAVLHRNAGDAAKALEAYRDLADLGAPLVAEGIPAALAGLLGALTVYDGQGDQIRAKDTALAIDRDLHAGRWPISRTAYNFFVIAREDEDLNAQLARWMPREPVSRAVPRSLAEAVHHVSNDQARMSASLIGQGTLQTPDGPVLVVWRSSGDAAAAFVAHPVHLRAHWPELASGTVSLSDGEGRAFVGPPGPAGAATLLPSATGLPWIVQATDTGEDGEAALRTRRIVLVSSLGVLLMLILTGGLFIGRAVARDLAVARLQSDFVSAVSHEFRTPLTTLCQLTELLVRGRVASEGDRQTYYAHLHAESDRLRRLMDGLLNFGQLEAGRMLFRFEPLDASTFVTQSAAAFQQAQPAGHRFEIAAPQVPAVRADPEALRCAFWNLLENAVKYSPEAEVVRVAVTSRGRDVEIAVSDQGVGIPKDEQRRIFDSFVRGSAARERSIRGTGVGLAMVRQIVRAHGGRIRVDSEPGAGSTFTLSLPVADTARPRA